MAELPKDPNNRELLDRIIKLEDENSRLRTQINDLEKDHEKLCVLVRKHVIRLDDRLLGIDDQLFDVLEKLFPGNARTQAQILDILKPSWREDKPA